MAEKKKSFNAMTKEQKDTYLYNKIMSHVKIENECFVWLRGKDKNGYGCITFDKESLRTHREMYRLKKGNIEPGKMVCHTCDNTSCCNPKHLYLGTAKQNTADMINRKRNLTDSGGFLGRSKLTKEDVIEIRKLLDLGVTQAHLARKYSIGRDAIYCIKARRTWKHVE
jgi:hypothetical protein